MQSHSLEPCCCRGRHWKSCLGHGGTHWVLESWPVTLGCPADEPSLRPRLAGADKKGLHPGLRPRPSPIWEAAGLGQASHSKVGTCTTVDLSHRNSLRRHPAGLPAGTKGRTLLPAPSSGSLVSVLMSPAHGAPPRGSNQSSFLLLWLALSQ